MTDSIKPPSFGAGPSRVGFDSQPDATGAVSGANASAGTSAVAAPAVGLAEQLRSGALTPAQVVDAVVAQALEQARAQGLPAAEEAHLERVLRTAMTDDPTLAGLARELER